MMPISRTKKVAVLALVLIITLWVVLWALPRMCIYAITPEEIKHVNDIRAKLLYHTDHQELLRVCREKLAAYNESVSHNAANSGGVLTIPQSLPGSSEEDANSPIKSAPTRMAIEDVPKKTNMRILDLRPTFVRISRNKIHLEMCTGFYSVGVTAFSEGVEGFGNMKLIDGLWYNDDGFRKYHHFQDHLEKLKTHKITWRWKDN